MIDLTLDLDLNPQPLERARVVTNDLGTRAYTPARSRAFYADLRTRLAYNRRVPRDPITSDLIVELAFYRRCRSIADRGDVSNLVKAVEDACNPSPRDGWCGLWRDDRQIVDLRAVLLEWGPTVHGRIVMHLISVEEALTDA